jgi:uncharacterized membrane-anchored protein YjiN (DUF445 family)
VFGRALDKLRGLTARSDEPRARALRRMQRIATLLLAAMALVFIAASATHSKAWWVGYIRAFSEAAVVGACADWFAVTALFRRPFGLPIPHTAIIPRNKDRIGRGMGRFIAENFLAAHVLEERLERIDAARWVVEHLDDPAKAGALAQRFAPMAGDLLAAFTDESLGELIGRGVRRAAESLPAAPIAGRVVLALREDGETEALYDKVTDLAASWVAANEEFIRHKVEENTARWIPGWVDRLLADRVMVALLSMLDDVRTPDHPWRGKWDEWVVKTAAELTADPKLHAQGEALKQRLLDSPRLNAEVHKLWGRLRERWAESPEDLAHGLDHILTAIGRRLAEDEAAREALNRWLRALALKAVAPRAPEIAHFVTEVVERWDARTVVERMELQVGRDLQYIRINGTVVGGLVGLLIHAVETAV